MAIISKQEVEDLAKKENTYSISMYIPTQRTGDNEEGKIRLKNHIKAVTDQLEDKGMKDKKLKEVLKPVQALLDDVKFWNHLSDGLAIFCSPDFFKLYTVPVSFPNSSMVRKKFHLLPLMQLFQGDGRFFVLALSMKKVRLFEGTRDTFAEIEIRDIVPGKLSEVTGADVEQKSLQFRSGQSDRGRPVYHGKGEGKDDKKDEIVKYLQQIEKGITDLLSGYQSPLIIAAVDYIYAIYRDVNNYSYLHHENVSGNTDEDDMHVIHDKAWEVIKDHFEARKKEMLKNYEFYQSKNKATSKIEEIIPASIDGAVDTVFIEKNKEVWGNYDKEANKIVIDSGKKGDNLELLDLIAVHSFINGGKVYVTAHDELPEEKEASAILRY